MVERPVEKPGLMRRTPESHSINLGPAVFKIDNVLQDIVCAFVALEDPVVIAGDHQHVFEAESAAEVIKLANRVKLKSSVDVRIAGPIGQNISGENQHVALGNPSLAQPAVTI